MSTKQLASILCSLILGIGLSACSSGSGPKATSLPATPTQTSRELPAATASATDTATPPVTPTPPVTATPDATVSPTSENKTPTRIPAGLSTPAPSGGATQPGPNFIPAPTALQPTAIPAARDCTDIAAFIEDVNIPDETVLEPNTKFTKTWRVRNAGTCTWDESYHMAPAGGDMMNSPQFIPMPVVAPGETADISVELTTPNRGGALVGYWKFRNYAGKEFGAGVPPVIPMWVNIHVTFWQVQITPTSEASSGGGSTDSGQGSGGDQGSGSDQGSGGSTGGDQASSGCQTSTNPAYIDTLLNLINAARAQNGLEAVVLQDQLSAAALAHSTDMACQNYVDHTGSDGSTWRSRVAAQGYANATTARENIYVGNPAFGGNAEGAFNWWMNSQVHRDNILYADVSEVGIAYVFRAQSQYGGYYTLVLARP